MCCFKQHLQNSQTSMTISYHFLVEIFSASCGWGHCEIEIKRDDYETFIYLEDKVECTKDKTWRFFILNNKSTDIDNSPIKLGQSWIICLDEIATALNSKTNGGVVPLYRYWRADGRFTLMDRQHHARVFQKKN